MRSLSLSVDLYGGESHSLVMDCEEINNDAAGPRATISMAVFSASSQIIPDRSSDIKARKKMEMSKKTTPLYIFSREFHVDSLQSSISTSSLH